MKTPTDEQLNLAMCEWMGWLCLAEIDFGGPVKLMGRRTRDALGLEVVDNYLSDDSPRRLLNEAEAKLTHDQYHTGYKQTLAVLVGLSGNMRVHSATARQRVVAILQVVKPELFKPNQTHDSTITNRTTR